MCLFLPVCLALLKTLISLSCTPMPVLSCTASVALSLLPLLMEPLAWVLKTTRTRIKQSVNEHSYNMKYCSKQHKDWPVTPVDVFLKYRYSKHVHVVVAQNQLPVFSSLQVDALDLVCPGVAPIKQTLLSTGSKKTTTVIIQERPKS